MIVGACFEVAFLRLQEISSSEISSSVITFFKTLCLSIRNRILLLSLLILIIMLTLSWPGKFLFHPKIGCFNFKPQYLLNYSSPKNDLYSVRKRRTRAFKSIFKLLGWGPASAGPLRAKFFARSPLLAFGFAALAPDFATKLCTRRVSACFSTCFKTF